MTGYFEIIAIATVVVCVVYVSRAHSALACAKAENMLLREERDRLVQFTNTMLLEHELEYNDMTRN